MFETIVVFALSHANILGESLRAPIAVATAAAANYEVRIRLDGRVSTTQVRASDAGHARRLVQAQFGPKVTVLSVKRLD